jgi:hypothetical protein
VAGGTSVAGTGQAGLASTTGGGSTAADSAGCACAIGSVNRGGLGPALPALGALLGIIGLRSRRSTR